MFLSMTIFVEFLLITEMFKLSGSILRNDFCHLGQRAKDSQEDSRNCQSSDLFFKEDWQINHSGSGIWSLIFLI
jgi:hypothetical protein